MSATDTTAQTAPTARASVELAQLAIEAVMITALGAFVVWYDLGPAPAFSYAVIVAVTVLIIACPCALGLATPKSLTVGMGKGAEQGVLFRGGDALQAARRLDTVVLDKTGTITHGKPALTNVIAAPGFDEREVLWWAAAVERSSEHPLAQAIVDGATDRKLEFAEPDRFEVVPGHGVEARLNDTAVLLLGNRKLMSDHAVATSGLDDAAAALAADGLEVAKITGDNQATAQAIAAAGRRRPRPGRGPARGQGPRGPQAPARGPPRRDGRRRHQRRPALTQADVGFAIGTGTDIAIEASDVTLVGGSLRSVVTAVEISHATIRNVKQNLIGAFIYNGAGLPIAAGVFYPLFGVLLSPLIASVAMAFSSVTVVSNANRLRTWQPKEG